MVHRIHVHDGLCIATKPFLIDPVRILHHFLQLDANCLLMLAAKGKRTLEIVEQSNITRLSDFPAQEIACDIPSDLNNGLERPA
jgi:hypothetical protein